VPRNFKKNGEFTMKKMPSLMGEVVSNIIFVLLNSGVVLIVRHFAVVFLCPAAAVTPTAIDFAQCVVTTQQAVNGMFTFIKTDPASLAQFTALTSVVVHSGVHYVSRKIRAAKMELRDPGGE
jgi:hypothetical protein